MLLPKQQRLRCPAHLTWVRTLRCCVPTCRQFGVEVHHLLQGRGGKVLAGDDFAVPLCGGPTGGHHRGGDSPHGVGNERRWQERHGIDLIQIAEDLQRRSPAWAKFRSAE